ncbi:MAG: DUF547 domain-containing protein [Cyanobacteria bacterium REEB67]|nr:DUF547 domain-containing protein [Cyanobacteria bacterium REEB67]
MLLAFLLLVALFCPQSVFGAEKHFDQDYRVYGSQLRKYVEGDSGMVHYARWQKDQKGLDAFLRSVAELDSASFEKFDREQKLAFWLNVYNALAIKSVLDHYPIKASVDYFPANSIRQFNDGWEVLSFKVIGSPITLYDIEHDRLRLGFRDPRVHFAVASASVDSAPLSPEPYRGRGLDQRLELLAHRFFERPSAYHFSAEKNQVAVSKIFSWFTLDFAGRAGFKKIAFPPPTDADIVLSYIALYLPPDQRLALEKARQSGHLVFDYLPYDWTLNDAD